MKIGENTGKVMLHNNIQCYSTGYFITETEINLKQYNNKEESAHVLALSKMTA